MRTVRPAAVRFTRSITHHPVQSCTHSRIPPMKLDNRDLVLRGLLGVLPALEAALKEAEREDR